MTRVSPRPAAAGTRDVDRDGGTLTSAAVKVSGAEPVFSKARSMVRESPVSEKVSVSANWWGQSSSCSAVGSRRIATLSWERDPGTTAHSEFRANPCWAASGPRSPNCGKHTGMPPRIALGGLKTASSDTNSRSTPSEVAHDVTCAPWRYTVAAAPPGPFSSTLSMPLSP